MSSEWYHYCIKYDDYVDFCLARDAIGSQRLSCPVIVFMSCNFVLMIIIINKIFLFYF